MKNEPEIYVPAGVKSYLCKKCHKQAEFLLLYYDLNKEYDQVEKGACQKHLMRVFKERRSAPNELIDILNDWAPQDDLLAKMVEKAEENQRQRRIKL